MEDSDPDRDGGGSAPPEAGADGVVSADDRQAAEGSGSGARGTETVVIGAGPAGLAVAGRLTVRGRPFVLLEKADRVADAWHRHYDRLHLHTVRETSHLPHRPFPPGTPRYVPRLQLVAYLERYAREMGIDPRLGTEVVAVERRDGGWATRTRDGEAWLSRHVVVATGFNRVPRVPSWPGMEAYRGTVEHSSAYRSGAPHRDRDVLVVGMGNTGAELALDLLEHGARPVLSVRGPVNIVPRDILGLPTQRTAMLLARLPDRLEDALGLALRRLTVGDLSPWGIETPALPPAAQLRETGKTPVIDVGTVERIRSGEIRVRPGIDRFLPDGVCFSDGRSAPFDHVVLATGYDSRVGDFVEDAGALLDENGHPAPVSAGGRHRGLHFVGFDGYSVGGILGTIHRDSGLVADAVEASGGPG